MTREEAKEALSVLKIYDNQWLREAIDMAIEALSADAKTKCVAQIKVNTEEVVRRIKEEYDIIDGWIPCSERLPKEYAQYLVCLKSGECYVYWLEDSDWAKDMAKKDGIFAWMPLPTPYREENEE